MVVFDMAGTTVDEKGLVYQVLKRSIRDAGAAVTDDEFCKWHGANKSEVIAHFASKAHPSSKEAREKLAKDALKRFDRDIDAAYTVPGAIAPMRGFPAYFQSLRAAGIKPMLNSGFPRRVAESIIAQLAYGGEVDGLCVAEDVGGGRPLPLMVQSLMRTGGVADPGAVAKVGDTVRDIEEGLNSHCGVIIGVLSGADSREALMAAGATAVYPTASDIPI